MNIFRAFFLIGFLVVLPMAPSGAHAQAGAPSAATDVMSVLTQNGQFGTFVKLIDAAGLADTLRKGGPVSVFAPTDEAFAKLPSGAVAELLKPESKERLTLLLNYHLAPGKVSLAELGKLEVLMTLAGEELEIDPGADGKSLLIDDARVKNGDLPAGASVVHVIDSVLQP